MCQEKYLHMNALKTLFCTLYKEDSKKKSYQVFMFQYFFFVNTGKIFVIAFHQNRQVVVLFWLKFMFAFCFVPSNTAQRVQA